MNLLILPGKQSEHKNWAEQVQLEVAAKFETIDIQYCPEEFDGSKKSAEDYIRSVNRIDTNDRFVIGRSIGGVALLDSIKRNDHRPRRCVFVGLLVDPLMEQGLNIEILLSRFSLLSLFIQGSDDPSIPYSKLRSMIGELAVRNCLLFEFPGGADGYDAGRVSGLVRNFSA